MSLPGSPANLLLAATVGGHGPHPVMILPFGLMLLAIALMPYLHSHWWEANYPMVAVSLAAITVIYYVLILGQSGRMLHVAHEYASFIALIGGLFVVAGGIHIRVKGLAQPSVNCVFLLIGAVLSNVIGTTGASMVLIRPWIRMNRYRISGFHVVFFIFIVSNVGGCLTPIGDPPLFLGYIKGVPFWWVLTKCWAAWAVVMAGLVGVFYALDRKNFLRTPRDNHEAERAEEAWRFDGMRNLAFLSMILGAVFLREPAGASEAVMVVAGLGSWFATPKAVHEANDFSFAPMREVAWLFLGIFATMAPALDWLEHHAGQLGLDTSMRLFWSTGGLSAALDNAPTYLTFLAVAVGRQGLTMDQPAQILQFATSQDRELMAISLGAVFFGAATYIGNGPNFMVKSICERAKIRTPGFAEYVYKYAIPVLLPILGAVALLFFSCWRVL